MPFRHVVLLTLDDGCDVDGFVDALRGLPGAIPQLRSYVVGRDLGLRDGNASVAIVADCDDEAAWHAYLDHPAHRQVVDGWIAPHAVSRTSVQHVT